MKVKSYIAIIVIFAGSSVLAFGNESNETVSLKRPHKDLGFETFTDAALKKDLSNNVSLVGSELENCGLIRRLRLELARRGDRQEQQKLFTDLHSTNLIQQSQALEDVALIANIEAVYQLAQLLNDPTPGGRITTSSRDGTVIRSTDQAVLPPRVVAASKLAELIDDAPVAPIGKDKKFYTEDDVKVWQKWWQTNKARFEKLRNTQ